MNLRVRTLDFNYGEDGMTIVDVNARFDINGVDGNFINGVVKLTKEEYDAIDVTSISDVAVVVKAKLKEQIASL